MRPEDNSKGENHSVNVESGFIENRSDCIEIVSIRVRIDSTRIDLFYESNRLFSEVQNKVVFISIRVKPDSTRTETFQNCTNRFDPDQLFFDYLVTRTDYSGRTLPCLRQSDQGLTLAFPDDSSTKCDLKTLEMKRIES